MSKIVKKNVLQNVVPIVIELKRILEGVHSPLIRHLMCAIRELLRDYKEEMKDILAGDARLAQEIEYDMRQFEQRVPEPGHMQREGPAPGDTPGPSSSSTAAAASAPSDPSLPSSSTPSASSASTSMSVPFSVPRIKGGQPLPQLPVVPAPADTPKEPKEDGGKGSRKRSAPAEEDAEASEGPPKRRSTRNRR